MWNCFKAALVAPPGGRCSSERSRARSQRPQAARLSDICWAPLFVFSSLDSPRVAAFSVGLERFIKGAAQNSNPTQAQPGESIKSWSCQRRRAAFGSQRRDFGPPSSGVGASCSGGALNLRAARLLRPFESFGNERAGRLARAASKEAALFKAPPPTQLSWAEFSDSSC